MMNILGVIPARGGSKSIPNKNLRELAGHPLLAYTAECARSSGVIDRLIISTDSEKIAAQARSLDIEVPFMRPVKLAQDETPMLPVLQHAVAQLEADGWRPDMIVLLQPTSPLRKPEHIRDAVKILSAADADSLVSVVEIPHEYSPQKALRSENGYLRFWHEDGYKITRRQQLEPAYAREGTVYAFWRKTLVEKNSIYGEKCLPLAIGIDESLNLDTLEDWQRAEERLGPKEKSHA